MPEGPEVRRFADAVDQALRGRVIKEVSARTVSARKWLSENGNLLLGRRVLRVRSHGKHLVGQIHGRFYFHSHLMMWGRWLAFDGKPPEQRDRRERARIVVDGGGAILYSAPIFYIGHGNPADYIEHLASLGPDVLPYKGKFQASEFRRRLLSNDNVTIGAALLDQRIVAGLGNYLRAEILFQCRINPWKTIGELNKSELKCIERAIPELARRAYLNNGATADDAARRRMREDRAMVYQPNREYGTRHMVFRRTNLPCLLCGKAIRQLRQTTHHVGDEERQRIIYFCANCQDVDK